MARASDDRAVVACLGSSATAAKGSYDWIADLQSRPQNAALRFLNFGVGGDLAFNALERLPVVLRSRPAKLIVLIGGNDALTAASGKLRRFLGCWKKFPQEPSAAWYETNLRRIVREARQQSDMSIALCSLVPVGECPDSQDPFQERINALIRDYSAIVKRVADDECTAYVPVYERMREKFASGRALTGIGILSMYRDAFRHLVLRWPLDKIADRNGWKFHTDGIHLNSRGGKILADAVQDVLEKI